MRFNYDKLRGRIIEKYGNNSNFAKDLKVSKNTLSLKLNNKVRFTSENIIHTCELLEISKEDIPIYFFTNKA